MKKYKLFNPNTGVYTDYENLDKLKKDLPKVILDFYLNHCHNVPYSVVTVNEDNSESWRAPNEDETIDFSKVVKQLGKYL